jgi:hypothetical protein
MEGEVMITKKGLPILGISLVLSVVVIFFFTPMVAEYPLLALGPLGILGICASQTYFGYRDAYSDALCALEKDPSEDAQDLLEEIYDKFLDIKAAIQLICIISILLTAVMTIFGTVAVSDGEPYYLFAYIYTSVMMFFISALLTSSILAARYANKFAVLNIDEDNVE